MKLTIPVEHLLTEQTTTLTIDTDSPDVTGQAITLEVDGQEYFIWESDARELATSLLASLQIRQERSVLVPEYPKARIAQTDQADQVTT